MADDAAKVVGTCPKCGGRVVSAGRTYSCEHNTRGPDETGKWVANGSCDFQVWKEFGGAKIGIAKMRKLFDGEVVEHACSTREGLPYVARLSLDLDTGKVERARERMGTCPKCGGVVYSNGRTVKCENDRTRPDGQGGWVNEGSCDFHVPKSIKGVALDDDEVRTLVRGDAIKVRGMEGRKGPFDAWVRIEASDERFWSFEFDDDDEDDDEDEEPASSPSGEDADDGDPEGQEDDEDDIPWED